MWPVLGLFTRHGPSYRYFSSVESGFATAAATAPWRSVLRVRGALAFGKEGLHFRQDRLVSGRLGAAWAALSATSASDVSEFKHLWTQGGLERTDDDVELLGRATAEGGPVGRVWSGCTIVKRSRSSGAALNRVVGGSVPYWPRCSATSPRRWHFEPWGSAGFWL